MNKLVYSALALTLVSVPGIASENEWSSLDQQINNLSSSLSAQNTSGPKVGGWVISSLRYSNDDALQQPDPVNPPDTKDQFGFQLDSVRIEITGDAGSDYSYKISFDFAGGASTATTATLKDAYATWKIGDAINGKMGNFKSPFSRSSLVSDNRLLFLQRTYIGQFYNARDLGLQFSGNFDTVNWFVAGQNGVDAQGDDFKFTGRVEANLMGAGVGKLEGAYGAGEGTNLTVGVMGQDDGGLDDGSSFGADVELTAGPFSAQAEIVNQGDDVVAVGGTDSATPWDATLSYMFTDMYEVAGRYEDHDDPNNTTAWFVGVNRYVQGHDIKWMLQWASQDADGDANDFDQVGLGLAVSF